jgi:hypothetical protein
VKKGVEKINERRKCVQVVTFGGLLTHKERQHEKISPPSLTTLHLPSDKETHKQNKKSISDKKETFAWNYKNIFRAIKKSVYFTLKK